MGTRHLYWILTSPSFAVHAKKFPHVAIAPSLPMQGILNSCPSDQKSGALTKGLAGQLVLAMVRQVSPYENFWPRRHIFTLEMNKIVEKI
jgi:hypothetical protein